MEIYLRELCRLYCLCVCNWFCDIFVVFWNVLSDPVSDSRESAREYEPTPESVSLTEASFSCCFSFTLRMNSRTLETLIDVWTFFYLLQHLTSGFFVIMKFIIAVNFQYRYILHDVCVTRININLIYGLVLLKFAIVKPFFMFFVELGEIIKRNSLLF